MVMSGTARVEVRLSAKSKYCPACQTDKPIEEFSVARSSKDGRASYCKPCRAEYMRKYYKTHKPRLRTQQKEKLYAMDPGEYDRRLKEQGGECAICGKTPDHTLHVDHDHKTGEVRGLLCHKCNNLLANAEDDAMILHCAIKYLDRDRR